MISLKKKKFDLSKKPAKESKEYAKKIERELPYFITLIALMASSGISPYFSLKKIMSFDLLPTMRKEAKSMIKQVEVLGVDPLTVMNDKAERTPSNVYQDFLAGYVSTVHTGGSVINFLKSKMWSIFDLHAALTRQLVTKIAGLIDAYMIIQVVILTLYIMIVALSSTPSLSMSMLPDPSSLSNFTAFFLILPPVMAGILMFIASQMSFSTYMNIEKLILKGVAISFAAALVMVFLSTSGTIDPEVISLPYMLGAGLLVGTIWPVLEYERINKMNSSAERSTPAILRDIAEARKTGLSPERCIIHGFKRKGYGIFSSVLQRAISQLNWGVPLRKILDNIRSKVSSWYVLINMKILVEVIESGGGYSDALDTLAKAAEQSYNVEKEKQSMLKPYIMIAFMIMGITGFTTLMVIDVFSGMTDSIAPGITQTNSVLTSEMRSMFAASIIVQAYLVGLFLGKVTTGTFAGGFKYAAMLVLTVVVSVLAVDYAPIDITSMFSPPKI